MLKRRIVQYWTTIKDTCKKHRKTAIAILLIIAVAAGGSVGYKVMTSTDSGVASDEQKLEQAKEAEEEAVSEEKKAEEELKKAKESGDKEAIEKAEKEAEKTKEQVNASNSSSQNSNSNSGASNKGSYSKPSNNGSSSSSSSSASKPSKPAHQHNWQPVYKEYTTQIIDPNNPSYVACNDCGANLGRNGEKWMDHADATGHEHGTTRVYNYITKTEEKVVGYKCSCGATK